MIDVDADIRDLLSAVKPLQDRAFAAWSVEMAQGPRRVALAKLNDLLGRAYRETLLALGAECGRCQQWASRGGAPGKLGTCARTQEPRPDYELSCLEFEEARR